MKTVVLRHEIKSHERRTPLTPVGASILLKDGGKVIIESSPTRIFSDAEYVQVGCEIVEMGYWRTCPKDYLILGLKELPLEDFPIEHKHIYFAHIFKGQEGSTEVFKRYTEGGGELFDLEFLTDQNNKRVCAFGYWAGYVGGAVSLLEYFQEGGLNKLSDFDSKELLIQEIRKLSKDKPSPKILIIGALGRCGTGARDLLQVCGFNSTNWDLEETKNGGPYDEILDHHIFINAALIFKKINPFLTKEMILRESSLLKVVSDVSCDPNSDLNPIPIYDRITSWEAPSLRVENKLSVIAVDNLPSVLPKESSEDFAEQLFPHLYEFIKKEELPLPFSNAKISFENART